MEPVAAYVGAAFGRGLNHAIKAVIYSLIFMKVFISLGYTLVFVIPPDDAPLAINPAHCVPYQAPR